MNGLPLEYKTVSQTGESEIIEKKSRFLGIAKPVSTETEAIEFLNGIRKKYADATHNVYAYMVSENNVQRYSDDGEPSGTAGMPVLDSIRKRGLTDTAVVVTRYFGGTLLGTGGLVHAYGKCASAAIDAAAPVICRLCNIYEVSCDYSASGKITHVLEGGEFVIRNTVYTEVVRFTVCVKQGADDKFIKTVTEASNGRAKITVTSNEYVSIPVER